MTNDDGWLQWDEKKQHFFGTVSRQIASDVGAERFEAYTVPLELAATIVFYFPGCMAYTQTFRVALPLTVKRYPDRCAMRPSLPTTPHQKRLERARPAITGSPESLRGSDSTE